jgi:hypothetical protein
MSRYCVSNWLFENGSYLRLAQIYLAVLNSLFLIIMATLRLRWPEERMSASEAIVLNSRILV